MRLSDVPTPALCVDLPALERNLERMHSFFREGPCSLRPHFKAHKTPAIAKLQVQAGCAGFTCATLGEAEVLAAHGFEDLLIANEVCDHTKIPRLARLAASVPLLVAIDSVECAGMLAGSGCDVLVDVNVGLPRCGVAPEGALEVAEAAKVAGLRVRGVMGYEGHATIVEEGDARAEVVRESMSKLMVASDALQAAGHEVEIVSAGSTGTYDLTGTTDGVTEIQAGSYVLMDTAYAKLGLGFEEALRCLCTVLSVQGGLAVLDAGLKALSVDHGNPEVTPELRASVLFCSDEHTTLLTDEGFDLRPGDRAWLRPSHVDPTVNLHDRLYAFSGEEVVEVWEVEARGYRSPAG